jgi:arylsulfatase A-like enzyme/cytochrome c-type biogenesis protein CcmH/NrfG
LRGLALLLAALVCGATWNEPLAGSEPTPKSAAAPRTTSPNLLLITMDTTRADALGAYGQVWDTSPNIDRLATAGVLFEQVTASSPETLPSHASIFTGKWPFIHGVRANAGYVLSDRHLTLAEFLSSRGYLTAAEIAAPVLGKKTQIAQGFDQIRDAYSPGIQLKKIRFTKGNVRTAKIRVRVGADITSKGIEFLRINRNRKFFLWLHYFDAHDPYSAPAMFNQRIPKSPYHAEVASEDFQIGVLIDELERLGLREKTLVVVTADHGEGLSDHGEFSHSYFVYETTMRVPLILWGLKQLPKGVRIPSPVRTVDITPTVLDLLGLPPLDGIQGAPLTPLIRGGKTDLSLTGYGEATRFLETFGLPALRFVREGRWKYIHKVNPELYDVIADPSEQTNLASRHPEIVRRLRTRLEEMLRQADPNRGDAKVAVDSQTAAQLAALGYVAESPAGALEDDLASLKLSGDDPVTKVGDTEILSAAQGLLDRKEFAEALQLLLPVRERNPESSYILGLVATALLGLERNEEAVEVLREILKIEPANIEKGHLLATILAEQGRYGEAADTVDALLARAPCDERIRTHQKRLLYELGRHEALVAMLEDGAGRCPDSLVNLNNFAWALATLPRDDLRDGAKAVRIIRSAISRLEEPDPAYLDTLAAALAETGDFDEAIHTQSKMLRLLRAAGAPDRVLTGPRKHLEAYQAREPIRDPAATPP